MIFESGIHVLIVHAPCILKKKREEDESSKIRTPAGRESREMIFSKD